MVGEQQQPNQESASPVSTAERDVAPTAGPALAEESPPRSRFRWGRFVSHLATLALAGVVVAIVAGVVMGTKPLRAKATSLTQRVECKVSITWPALNRPKDAPAPKSMDEITWLPEQLRAAVHGYRDFLTHLVGP